MECWGDNFFPDKEKRMNTHEHPTCGKCDHEQYLLPHKQKWIKIDHSTHLIRGLKKQPIFIATQAKITE